MFVLQPWEKKMNYGEQVGWPVAWLGSLLGFWLGNVAPALGAAPRLQHARSLLCSALCC
jgi:hypothetical protein